MVKRYQFDVLVIGSGAAGLTAALQLADCFQVGLICKSQLHSGATMWAQGGIAGVFDQNDNIDWHAQDTARAGAGLCHLDSVHLTTRNAPAALRWLIDQQVDFTRSDDPNSNGYHLTKEGGHSHRRILHSADATGKAISNALVDRTIEHPNIQTYENHTIIDLITDTDPNSRKVRCIGAYVLDIESDRSVAIQAKAVILATGGASKAYLYTSNPDGASGDGIAAAWRRGCRVANMEFNQFHPTCLYHPQARTFLITEALRGEGAQLLLPDGTRFMQRFHADGELAPRDIVARAIDHEMKRLGCECVYLDISHKPADFIEQHFPTVRSRCLEYGIDITREPIPVVPAAHYTCGGVMVDQYARTDLQNLYAVGETSFTGLHGANRLASNSLLECVVYASSAANHIKEVFAHIADLSEPPLWDESQVTHSDEDVVLSHNWDELRRFMWDYVGIVRTNKRLERALHRVQVLQREIHEYYSNYKISKNLLEVRNLTMVAELIIRSAIQRKESRGLHYTLDHPQLDTVARDSIMIPENYAAQDIIIRACSQE